MDKYYEDKISMKLDRISWYSRYVDCFSRILNDYIENGVSNISPCDIPNLSELLAGFSKRLNRKIIELKSDWEFR